MISIGEAAWLNAAVYEGPRARLLEGWLVERHLEDLDTGTVMAHYRRGEIHYLAVRGTWSGSDIAESLRVFLGQEPTRRMRFLQDYIQDRFDPVDPRRVLVGGHSLGGLVAAGAAERWHLAGLAQNAPGWMQPRHDNSRLDRFLEVRTSRDVVGDWGAEFPRSLVLTDPSVRNWDISGLHNLERQNQLLRDQGWQDRALDDPALAPLLPCAAPLPGLAGLPIRMLRTLRKVRLQNAQVQGAGEQGPGQPRGARPRPG